MKQKNRDKKGSSQKSSLRLFFLSPPSQGASRVFGLLTAIGTNVGVFFVLLLALSDHPYRAVVLLGSGIIALGILRGLWPGRPWFASRHRVLDAIVYVVLGLAVLWLSPWTATISPF